MRDPITLLKKDSLSKSRAVKVSNGRRSGNGTYRPRLEPLESRIVPGFLAASSYPATVPGGIPNTIVMADFNHDGILDVATANYGANSASILLGKGDGSFASPITYPAGGNPQGLATGDFNEDGQSGRDGFGLALWGQWAPHLE